MHKQHKRVLKPDTEKLPVLESLVTSAATGTAQPVTSEDTWDAEHSDPRDFIRTHCFEGAIDQFQAYPVNEDALCSAIGHVILHPTFMEWFSHIPLAGEEQQRARDTLNNAMNRVYDAATRLLMREAAKRGFDSATLYPCIRMVRELCARKPWRFRDDRVTFFPASFGVDPVALSAKQQNTLQNGEAVLTQLAAAASTTNWEFDVLKGYVHASLPKMVIPDTRDTSSEQVNKADVNWQDIQTTLLRLRDAGERYTSYGELAKQLGCSKGTIGKAVNRSPVLKGWAARAKASPNAQRMNNVVADNTPCTRESDPADCLPDDDVDHEFNRLLQEAPPACRAQLNAYSPEQRREIARLSISQRGDDTDKIRGCNP